MQEKHEPGRAAASGDHARQQQTGLRARAATPACGSQREKGRLVRYLRAKRDTNILCNGKRGWVIQ
jgi:hypothetical protein